MPKNKIDYSNTIIYKIYCKDNTISDVYIGHTTNFIKRRHQHKLSCNSGYKLKIYDTIRLNGGWENWYMIELARYNCKDINEAKIKEQYHYEKHNSSLNSCPPYVDKSVYFCNICKTQCETSSDYNIHIETNKHKANEKLMPANENMPSKFYCDVCHYLCSKKSCWSQHIITAKHIKAKNGLMTANKKYACETCSTFFSHQSSYCRHKKKCQTEKSQIIQPSNMITTELVMELIKDNKEMKQIILEQNNTINSLVKNGVSNNNNNVTNSLNNNNNKTFNLQFFLNETCKDAMNIMDFVESIKLQLSDLEKVGDVGYVQGISNIITTNLKALDVTQRPVHCTDKKRETMYIKDEDKWEKEDDNKTKLRKVIKKVANKNIKLLPQFREKYPDYDDAESHISDKYSKMVIEVMGGSGNNNVEKEDKIINNISKCTTIEKYAEI